MKDSNTLQRTCSGKLIKVYEEIEEILDEVEAGFELLKKKNYDRIPNTPSDHRYASYKVSGLKEVLSGSSSGKKIYLEWENLKDNLSGTSIFVRTYEGRTDLMRAAIVGPPGSPYEYGLFFFDICLPWNYPSTPAKFFYRQCNYTSDNFDVIFKTWYERLLEAIDNKPISLLDILLAIHKLLSRPNTNKNNSERLKYSGMDVSPPVSHDSKLNDNSPTQGAATLELQGCDMMDFLSTCRKIICDLREPPKDFKDFVAGYYRQKAHLILLILKENMDVSDKLMVLLFKRLYEAFRKNGSYVEHFQGFLETLGEDSERARPKKNCWNIGAGLDARTLMNFLLNLS